MQFKKLVLIFSLVFLWSGLVPAHAATNPQPYLTPQSMLLAHYSAINTGDFETAYAFWDRHPKSLQNFIAGYNDTLYIDAYFGVFTPSATDATRGTVPGVLIGHKTDGNWNSYYGCITVRHDTEDGWKISLANMRVLTDASLNQTPDSTSINSLLSINCANPVLPSALNFINVSDLPYNSELATSALQTYYTLINQGDYPAAYGMWLQPIAGPKPNGAPLEDYRPSFDAFVNGYQDTNYVALYLGAYDYGGPYAGHSYVDGYQPAVLVGLHQDGTAATYAGCYLLGSLGEGRLGIIDGSFTLQLNDTPTGADVNAYLQSLDCYALGIRS